MANGRGMWILCCLGFAVCLGIFGVIGFIVSVSHGSGSSDDDDFTYCFAAEGNVANFPQTVVGRFTIDLETDKLCWALFYGTAQACDVDVIALKGAVNDNEGLRPSNVVATFSEGSTPQFGYVNGSLACQHVDARILRRIIRDPYLYYVEMNTTGANFCQAAVIRDYVTGLCRESDLEVNDDDDSNVDSSSSDGDDDDHHHHPHGHDDDDAPLVHKAKVGRFHKPQHSGSKGRA